MMGDAACCTGVHHPHSLGLDRLGLKAWIQAGPSMRMWKLHKKDEILLVCHV